MVGVPAFVCNQCGDQALADEAIVAFENIASNGRVPNGFIDCPIYDLERLLACQRTRVRAIPVAESFCDAWHQALLDGAALPDDFDLFDALIAEKLVPLAVGPMRWYLAQCRKDRLTPEPSRLAEALAHGFSEVRPLGRKRCRCLAHESLAPS
jgi:hypothetical protein